MLTRHQLEIFFHEFLDYFGKDIIAAEYDVRGRLVLYTNPYLDFNALVMHIGQNVVDIFNYTAHMEIILYPFGSNDLAQIHLN